MDHEHRPRGEDTNGDRMKRLTIVALGVVALSGCTGTHIKPVAVCDGKHRRPANLYGTILPSLPVPLPASQQGAGQSMVAPPSGAALPAPVPAPSPDPVLMRDEPPTRAPSPSPHPAPSAAPAAPIGPGAMNVPALSASDVPARRRAELLLLLKGSTPWAR